MREFKDRLHVLPANMVNIIWPHAKSPAASAPAAPADSLLADKFESFTGATWPERMVSRGFPTPATNVPLDLTATNSCRDYIIAYNDVDSADTTQQTAAVGARKWVYGENLGKITNKKPLLSEEKKIAAELLSRAGGDIKDYYFSGPNDAFQLVKDSAGSSCTQVALVSHDLFRTLFAQEGNLAEISRDWFIPADFAIDDSESVFAAVMRLYDLSSCKDWFELPLSKKAREQRQKEDGNESREKTTKADSQRRHKKKSSKNTAIMVFDDSDEEAAFEAFKQARAAAAGASLASANSSRPPLRKESLSVAHRFGNLSKMLGAEQAIDTFLDLLSQCTSSSKIKAVTLAMMEVLAAWDPRQDFQKSILCSLLEHIKYDLVDEHGSLLKADAGSVLSLFKSKLDAAIGQETLHDDKLSALAAQIDRIIRISNDKKLGNQLNRALSGRSKRKRYDSSEESSDSSDYDSDSRHRRRRKARRRRDRERRSSRDRDDRLGNRDRDDRRGNDRDDRRGNERRPPAPPAMKAMRREIEHATNCKDGFRINKVLARMLNGKCCSCLKDMNGDLSSCKSCDRTTLHVSLSQKIKTAKSIEDLM